MATTEFESWLSCHIVPTDYLDVYNCYLAIHDKHSNYRFETKYNPSQDKLFVTPNGTSDTLMIASIDPKTNQASLLSVPRDTRVKIKGHGFDKINAAYAYGGPELALQTLNKNLDLTDEIINGLDKGLRVVARVRD